MKDIEIVNKLQAVEDYDKVARWLYKQHQAKIIKMATYHTGDKLDAEEIYNDSIMTFLAIVRSNEFDPSLSSISTFLYSIARFKCLKKNESNNRRINRDTHAFEDLSEEPALTPEQIIIAQERLAYLSTLLNYLCEKCRLIIEAHYLNELTWKVVAKMFDYASEDAVKMKGMRCLLKLRNFVSQN